MIQVKNLSRQIVSKVLFSGVNFHLRPGEKVGLVGENGSGKSTFFRTISGMESPDGGEVSTRKGINLAMLEQDLAPHNETLLERVLSGAEEYWSIKKKIELLEADEKYHRDSPDEWSRRYGNLQHRYESIGGYEMESSAGIILQGLGFSTEVTGNSISEFSGGMRIRGELARLLLQSPDVLLLDEPSNHLDLFSVVWLESFLKNYNGAIILISHDRKFLNGIVHRIVELDRGNLTSYSGNYDFYEREKAERGERLEAEAANQNKRIAEVERFIERFRAKSTKASQVKSKQKMLAKIERVETLSGTRQVSFRFPQPARTGRVVVDMIKLSKSYGDNSIYREFSACVERGFKIALVGKNGAGKSTLLKMVAGVLDHDEGEIRFGANVTRGYYAQHYSETLDGELSVLESMEEASPLLDRVMTRTILGGFLFSGDDVSKRVSVLSGGERARLALARMLSSPSSLLLLDEPTNHLDIRSCDVLAAALNDFEGALLTISHDRYFLDGIIDRVWEVDGGSVREYEGNYSEYERAKSLEQAVLSSKAETEGGAEDVDRGRERKREEAEERNRKYKRLKPLKAELEGVELRLEKLFEERSLLEEKMSDQGLYGKERKGELLEVLGDQKRAAEEEQLLMEEWDRLDSLIDSHSR